MCKLNGKCMTEQEEIELDYYIGMCSDLVPYSDPHYQERVVAMAKSVMEAEKNPDPSLVSLCEEHDRLLEKYGPDYFDPTKDTAKNTDKFDCNV